MEPSTATIFEAPECPVCLGVHEEDVHDATVALHVWLRDEIARRINPQSESLEATVARLYAGAAFVA
ncbi:MAG TPA: hypothetical protein VMH28_08010 [Candidatus Acidoferrales bacterium]|nr:hypothetical protein [Candidatus Acidoferrales bacterium]